MLKKKTKYTIEDLKAIMDLVEVKERNIKRKDQQSFLDKIREIEEAKEILGVNDVGEQSEKDFDMEILKMIAPAIIKKQERPQEVGIMDENNATIAADQLRAHIKGKDSEKIFQGLKSLSAADLRKIADKL